MNKDITQIVTWIEKIKIFSKDMFIEYFDKETFEYVEKQHLIMHVGQDIFEECTTGNCYNVAEVIALTQPTDIVTSEAALNFYDLGNRDFTDISFVDYSTIHRSDWCIITSRNNNIPVKIVTLNYLLLDLLCDIQKNYVLLEEIKYAFTSLTIQQLHDFEIYLKSSSREISTIKKEIYTQAKINVYYCKEWNDRVKI